MGAHHPTDAADPDAAEAGAAEAGADVQAVIAEALRHLVQARTSVEVADAVLDAVRRLGAAIVHADEIGEGAFPVDISFGVGPPVVPWAAPGSAAWQRLEAHLPRLVEDAHVAVNRVREREALAREVDLDPLTGVGNRRAYHRVLARVGRGDVLIAVDLDRFKPVNDLHGHAAGDEVLTGFAATLRAHARATDHVLRVGGDEFAVVLRSTDVRGAWAYVARVRAEWLRVRHHDVDFSAGIAAVGRDGGHVALEAADAALYEAKHAGGGRSATAPTARELA